MNKPIEIDLSGLKKQFGLSSANVNLLTEICVNEVTAAIYANWVAEAKKNLKSTLPEYLQNLHKIDKGRFAKQIVLTGVLPLMVERGASAFDMKEGFKKSTKVKFTVPVYNKKGVLLKQASWYLTVPFRIGVPGTIGQAGFTGDMPQEIYDLVLNQSSGEQLPASSIPSPYDIPKSRAEITVPQSASVLFAEYQHKNSIYDGLGKRTGVYANSTQNTYGTFRRVGENSDPLSWIHRGIQAHNLSEKAVQDTDVETIVNNETLRYLDKTL